VNPPCSRPSHPLTVSVKTASSSSNTQKQILDAAERLFATQGFAGTTLRNLVKEAGVNLAAVNYHFGSKEELHGAVMSRIAQVITQRQRQALIQLEELEKEPSVEAVIRAYIEPGMAYILEVEELRITRAQFMGRCRTEPAPLQQRASEEFGASHKQFLALLKRALPEQSEADLTWKLDIVVAMLVRTLTEIGRAGMLLRSGTQDDLDHAVSELVKFASNGIRAGSKSELNH